MNRRAALVMAGAFVAHPVAAASASTIVAVACNDPELSEDAEDFLAGALSDRHVTTFDPSAIDVTYHEQARLQVSRFLNSASVDYSALSWVTVRYHAQRLMAVNVRFTANALPYGAFTVYNVRARCSYRCFNVLSKTIVAAGSGLGTGRAEDVTQAQEDAMHAGLLEIARVSAARLA